MTATIRDDQYSKPQ